MKRRIEQGTAAFLVLGGLGFVAFAAYFLREGPEIAGFLNEAKVHGVNDLKSFEYSSWLRGWNVSLIVPGWLGLVAVVGGLGLWYRARWARPVIAGLAFSVVSVALGEYLRASKGDGLGEFATAGATFVVLLAFSLSPRAEEAA